MAKVTSGRARVFPVRSHRTARPFCFVSVPYADATLRKESTVRTGVQSTSECSESSFLLMQLTRDGGKRSVRDAAIPTTQLRARREPFQIRKFCGPGKKRKVVIEVIGQVGTAEIHKLRIDKRPRRHRDGRTRPARGD